MATEKELIYLHNALGIQLHFKQIRKIFEERDKYKGLSSYQERDVINNNEDIDKLLELLYYLEDAISKKQHKVSTGKLGYIMAIRISMEEAGATEEEINNKVIELENTLPNVTYTLK